MATAQKDGAVDGAAWMIPPFAYVDHGCEKLADGSQLWAVSLPGAPGCIAQGATLSEAVHHLADLAPRYIGFLLDELEKSSAENTALRVEKERWEWAKVNLAGLDLGPGGITAATRARDGKEFVDTSPEKAIDAARAAGEG